jgi:hypothetical protein
MSDNLGKNVKISSALDYASGTADVTGTIIDMQGYDGVLMILHAATIAAGAVTTFKAQQDTDSAGGTMADLEGTGISVADDDDNQLFIIDLYKPEERYVRCYLDKDASNAVGASAIYIQYNGAKAPFDNSVTDASTYELHISPDEGTA